MDPRPPDRLEELLMRAFDGETTPEEREELLALAELEPRLAEMAELRDALRAALAVPGPVDVAGGVFEALALDAAWDLGPALRDAVAAPVDVAGAVMAGLDEATWAPIGAAIAEAARIEIDVADGVMGALADEAELGWIGDALRDATARDVDVWAGVADAIGVERDAVHGWDEVAAPMRAAFAAIPPIDVADAVLAAVAVEATETARGETVEILRAETRGAPKMPLWASLGGPILAFAAAAAMLMTVLPAKGPGRTEAPAMQLATVNDAHVEEVSAPQDVVVQVMQFEEGGPTFILVDDPSGSGVPL